MELMRHINVRQAMNYAWRFSAVVKLSSHVYCDEATNDCPLSHFCVLIIIIIIIYLILTLTVDLQEFGTCSMRFYLHGRKPLVSRASQSQRNKEKKKCKSVITTQWKIVIMKIEKNPNFTRECQYYKLKRINTINRVQTNLSQCNKFGNR